MYVKCITAFGDTAAGTVTEVPDGSEVCSAWFLPCDVDGNLIAATTDPITGGTTATSTPTTPPVTPPVSS